MSVFDLTETQFLVKTDFRGRQAPIQAFTRRRALMLLNHEGRPIRLISRAEWLAMKTTWAAEVAADGLSARNVWVLEEIKPTA